VEKALFMALGRKKELFTLKLRRKKNGKNKVKTNKVNENTP
jgi:hypothetical protein